MTTFALERGDDGITVLRPEGRLNMVAAPALSAALEQLVADGRSRVVVDLSATTFMDSSGLGALIACLKKTRQAGGDLRLAAPTEQVTMVLQLTNVHRILHPYETVDAARVDL